MDAPEDDPKAIFLAYFLAVFQQLAGATIINIYSPEIAQAFWPSMHRFVPVFLNL